MRVAWVASAVLAAVLLGGAGLPILAFNRLQPGEWQLRAVDEPGTPPRRICLSDPYELIQMRHPGAACSRFVLTNDPGSATIHYTCTGAGYGRTSITVETRDLIRLESQGLVNQAPFQTVLEGRRIGACGQSRPNR